MPHLFVTRSEYDWLVQFRQSWVREYWSRFQKRWELGGVWCIGRDADVENLSLLLKERIR